MLASPNMENRRAFFKNLTLLGAAGLVGAQTGRAEEPDQPPGQATEESDRVVWINHAVKLATPVLSRLAAGEMAKTMPVEAAHPLDRIHYTYLEAFGRLLAGIAPWLGATGTDPSEDKVRLSMLALAQKSLDSATNPQSPDFMNFTRGSQPLVDAAFLALGLLRAPDALWHPLPQAVQRQIIQALESTRTIAIPKSSNWVLFPAMIETALMIFGQPTLEPRLEECLRHMLQWYKGDGVYGDGPLFHWDYYNSFVIHPMLLEILSHLTRTDARFSSLLEMETNRARRFAVIQERLIAPDATFPCFGRSITYRLGVFHCLAQTALRGDLPPPLQPAQVRSALTAVMKRVFNAPGTFNDAGWLQVGLYGHQPTLAETYISTGSLYLTATVLLPLGLSPDNPFWKGSRTEWTSRQVWSGQAVLADHALPHDIEINDVPSLNRAGPPPRIREGSG